MGAELDEKSRPARHRDPKRKRHMRPPRTRQPQPLRWPEKRIELGRKQDIEPRRVGAKRLVIIHDLPPSPAPELCALAPDKPSSRSDQPWRRAADQPEVERYRRSLTWRFGV